MLFPPRNAIEELNAKNCEISLVPAFDSKSRVEGEFNREINAGEQPEVCNTNRALIQRPLVKEVSSGAGMAFK